MAVQRVLAAPGAITNGRRPQTIEVSRSRFINQLCDWQALAERALDANGASLRTVRRLPWGPWRIEMLQAHIETHDRLVALLKQLRMAAGRYDGVGES